MARTIAFEGFPMSQERKLSVEGSRYVLGQPEFHDWEKSRRLFKALEGQQVLLDLLQGDLEREGVQVHIGFEHNCEEIQDCSFVTARYQVNDRSVGGLGILGPKRMPYERIISLVDYVARRFGEALEHW